MKNVGFVAMVFLTMAFAECSSNVDNSNVGIDKTRSSETKTQFTAATKIIYHFGDASVAPQWHRSYSITVTRSEAQLVIDSYGKIIDQATRDIAATDFEKLIETIRDANISKVTATSDSSGCTGGTSESLTIYDQETELLDADVYHCQGDWGTLSGNIGSVKAAMVDLFPDKRSELK